MKQVGSRSSLLRSLLFLVPFGTAHADNFQSATYDAARDELVIVVLYRGTIRTTSFR
jgi:hypothetical protein